MGRVARVDSVLVWLLEVWKYASHFQCAEFLAGIEYAIQAMWKNEKQPLLLQDHIRWNI